MIRSATLGPFGATGAGGFGFALELGIRAGAYPTLTTIRGTGVGSSPAVPNVAGNAPVIPDRVTESDALFAAGVEVPASSGTSPLLALNRSVGCVTVTFCTQSPNQYTPRVSGCAIVISCTVAESPAIVPASRINAPGRPVPSSCQIPSLTRLPASPADVTSAPIRTSVTFNGTTTGPARTVPFPDVLTVWTEL